MPKDKLFVNLQFSYRIPCDKKKIGEAWQLALLVLSSVNISLVSAYWAYLIYASYTHTLRWRPPLTPHLLLLGLALGACAGFPHLTPALLTACQVLYSH